jgi:membrane dipeptidase
VRHAFKQKAMMIIDSHEDIAWNMVNLKRDYTNSVHDIRNSEKNSPIPAFNGNTLLGWREYQAAEVAIVFGTLYCSPKRLDHGTYPVRGYETAKEAHACYRENLDAYMRLTDEYPEKFRLILNRIDLADHVTKWQTHQKSPQDIAPPIGLVILMEGAEGIVEPWEVEDWAAWGVRIIGPAWAGNRYCGGTREPGPLTKKGCELLEVMAAFNLILDISHMDHQSARQSLDSYEGQVIASHSNAEALIRGIPINRHLKDETIHHLIERDGVMGIVPLNGFLDWEWRNNGGKQAVGLDLVVAQIDHVCQIAGDTQHVGIGTDFDGGFGVESVPAEIDSIADLPKLAPRLNEKGYNGEDIENIFNKNWLRILRNNLPNS